MFNPEDFQLNIKAIADNVPDRFKSTLQGNMHYIVSQTVITYIQPKLEALEARLEELELILKHPMVMIERPENANEKGGFQKPQRNEKVVSKAARGGEE